MTESDIRDPHARRAVVLLERGQLEDKHLRLMEENLILKKHARSQEEKMKKMATKLLRLTSDEKKEAKRDGQWTAVHHRDLGAEERLDDLYGKVRQLEKQNTTLKSKNLVLRQQLETKGKRHSHYDHIQSRISTGLSRKPQKSMATDDVSKKSDVVSVVGVSVMDASTQSSQVGMAPCHNLLEEVRRDNQQLEESSLQLRQELAVVKADNERLKEQLRVKSLRSEEEKLSLQEELQAHITKLEKNAADEEVKLMKVQREMRDKSNRLQALQAKYNTLEQNLDAARTSHSRVLQEMELHNHQLKNERSRRAELESELRSKSVSEKAVSELEEMMRDIRTERDMLKRANDRLMKGHAESVEVERSELRRLEERMRQLEGEARQQAEEKTTAIDRLTRERELSEKLNVELSELRMTYYQLKEEHQQLEDKMKFYNKESSLDWGEVEEALSVIKEKKEKGEPLKSLSFLETLEDNKEHHRELEELRLAHADTINELEKTRKLLQLQHNINKDYKKEIESLKSRAEECRQQHASELREYAQLVDIKAARIKKLEGQLKDIAYGTRQYKLDTTQFEYEGSGSTLEDTIELERGQNLLQFHVAQLFLSPEVISQLHTPTPAIFISIHYSNFETHVTPVKQGARPCFNFTSNYVVTVNDTFLESLQKGCLCIEVHQALGLKYQKLAVSSVRLKDIITSSGGKVHGKAVLSGVESMGECVSVGTLDYWIRLKLPITQAIRLYQERDKALSLFEDGRPSLTTTSDKVTAKGPDYNELVITVNKCRGLIPNTSGQSPSAYVIYQFYTFPDHDTSIIPHSSDPQFSDDKIFPVSMDTQLDNYLKKQSLDVYVFDDNETEDSRYLLAQVPLLPLAQGRTSISNTYTLTQTSGESGGEIELILRWKHPYHIRADSTPAAQLPPLHSKASVPKQPAPKFTPSKPKLQPRADKDNHKIERTATKGVSASICTENAPQSLKSESKSSLSGAQSSSSPIVSESEDEISPIVSEESQESLAQPQDHPTVPAQPTLSAVAPVTEKSKDDKDPAPSALKSKEAVKITSSKPKKVTSTPLKKSLPPLTAKLSAIAKEPPSDRLAHKEQRNGRDVNVEGTASQTLDSSSDLVDVTDSEMSIMSGLNLNPVEDIPRQSTGINNEKCASEESNTTKHAAAIESDKRGGPGESSEGDESGSVTVTELSGEEEEEEIEEDIDDSGEDTMFEETLHQSGDDAVSSGLSEHSSDRLQLPSSKPIAPSLTVASKAAGSEGSEPGDDDSELLTPSASESTLVNGKPITSKNTDITSIKEGIQESSQGGASSSFMNITIESFTLEDDSSIATSANITNLFVEYNFLNFEYGELETPSSQPKPLPGEPAIYNFKKGFYLDLEQQQLLVNMLKPGDPSEGRITFTVVSDPENDEMDCEELGYAQVDLNAIFKNGKDLTKEAIDVYSADDDAEIIGYLIVSVEVSEFLRRFVQQ